MYLRLFLLATLLIGCSSGGGTSSTPTAPPMDWGSFRQNFSNTGQGRGGVRRNKGEVELLNADLGGVTNSTPVIGQNNRMYLGTETGLVGYWRFDDGSGTNATDSTSTGNDGSLGAGSLIQRPTWVTSTAPIIR